MTTYPESIVRRAGAAESAEYDAFLSYSGRDRKMAVAIHEYLGRAGLRVFIDSESVRTGIAGQGPEPSSEDLGAFDGGLREAMGRVKRGGMMREINEALQRSRAFVLLVTPEALDSSWVQLELQASEGRDRRRVFVDLEWAPLPARFDGQHVEIHWDPDDRRSYEAKFLAAMRELSTLLGGRVPDLSCRDENEAPYEVPRDTATRLTRPVRETLFRALQPLIDTTQNQRLDSVRRGLCSALGLMHDDHGFGRAPLCDHAELIVNHLMVILTRRYSPWRAAHRLAQTLLDGFRLTSARRTELRALVKLVLVRIEPDIDDAIVAAVRETLWPRYEVVEVLGGSKTVTLRAEDVSLGREVAIKVLRRVPPGRRSHAAETRGGAILAAKPDDRGEEEFAFRELTRNAARMRYPFLNQVHGARLDDSGVFLQIAEFIEGVSLSILARCARQGDRLRSQDLVEVVRGLGDALASLERDQCLHLNLSTRSVFVDGARTVMVSSLGVVDQSAEVHRLLRLFRDGPGRILPCEDLSESGKPSSRLLQFVLGRIVLELLLGEFRSDEAVDREDAIDRATVLLQPEPHARRVGEVLRRATASRPQGRYPSVEVAVRELSEALTRCVVHGGREFEHLFEGAMRIRRVMASRRQIVTESLARAMQNRLVENFSSTMRAIPEIRAVFRAEWRRQAREEREAWQRRQSQAGAKGARISETPPSVTARDRVLRYEEKLGRALRTIVVYGSQEGYRPLAMDLIAVSHGQARYDVQPDMYRQFCENLLSSLKERDPHVRRGVAAEAGPSEAGEARRILEAWSSLLEHVVSMILHSPAGRSVASLRTVATPLEGSASET